MKKNKKIRIKLSKHEKDIENEIKLGNYRSLGINEIKKHTKYAKEFIKNNKNKKK